MNPTQIRTIARMLTTRKRLAPGHPSACKIKTPSNTPNACDASRGRFLFAPSLPVDRHASISDAQTLGQGHLTADDVGETKVRVQAQRKRSRVRHSTLGGTRCSENPS